LAPITNLETHAMEHVDELADLLVAFPEEGNKRSAKSK
jgi:hypothetical protein